MRTSLKSSRVRRNIAATAVCGLAMLYDYDCGSTQTRNLDVTLTREVPGRPPMPCASISGGGGGGSGGGGQGGGGGGGGVTCKLLPMCITLLISVFLYCSIRVALF